MLYPSPCSKTRLIRGRLIDDTPSSKLANKTAPTGHHMGGVVVTLLAQVGFNFMVTVSSQASIKPSYPGHG